MLWFVVRYVLWLVLLFALFFIESISPLYFVQTWQTDLTIYLTHLWIDGFDIPVKMVGNTVYLDHGFNIWILDGCNGLAAYLLFGVAILAYPTVWLSRLIWLLEGYFYLVVINSIRIDFVVYLTMFDADYFYCAHDCIGRLCMVATTLLLFMLFTFRVQLSRQARNQYDRRKGERDRRHAHAHEWREAKEERRHNKEPRRKQQDRREKPPERLKL
ncbi:hypothetical protein THMIRHAM_10980 [Thiomicrorhabdus immobilis]|uniref:Exosortase/archaeosortase family protein n=1 Tax=Thiomicrorhabdus immobilis TaxID=2791037 RepID=A0ABN6CW82_9GAMM|nr:hypothetical protein [Thiomicrorhabdus immobilis]BCN93313.1 hypothetical protein THMIRHAM_10980 [Thiomicrorhabdus immobilis]